MAENSEFRVISRELPDNGRLLACVRKTDSPDQKSDEEILDAIQASMDARRLREAKDN